MAIANSVVFLVIYVIIMGFVTLIGIAGYILQGISMQTIAKRRGIENPWLAWVPIGNSYILGAVADDYNLKARLKKTNLRKFLLFFTLGLLVCVISLYPLLFTGMYSIMQSDGTGVGAALLVVLAILYVLVFGLSITVSVFQYIAIFRLLRSLSAKNGVLYFILSIFITGVYPLLIFFLRDSDEGMPIMQGE